MSTQTVPPIDIPTAVANPALLDSQAIMVNVGELRRMVRRAEQTERDLVAWYTRGTKAGLKLDTLRREIRRDWPLGDALSDVDNPQSIYGLRIAAITASRVAEFELYLRESKAQHPSIEDAIAAELEAGA